MDKSKLKQLINTEQWEEIGRIFDFRPSYCFVNGRKYFNWNSAPAAMMAVLQPPQKGTLDFRTKKVVVPQEPQKPNFRTQSFRDQKGLCYYCGKETEWVKWTIDHKTPKCRIKQHHREKANRIGCCSSCNHAKGSMTLDEFLRTDYLPQNRRDRIGYFDAPRVKFHIAKQEHVFRVRPQVNGRHLP